MTLNNTNIRIVKNRDNYKQHNSETMALLKKLLDNAGMNQAQLAQELNRDKTTINRWSNDSREITFENAKKIADILNCHPVDIYQPQHKIKVSRFVTSNLKVEKFAKEYVKEIVVPYEFYSPNIFAVVIKQPGFFMHGETFLFNKPNNTELRFSETAMNKFCYITPSEKFKKKYKNCHALLGVIVAENDKLTIKNTFTKKPVTENCVDLSYEDFDLALPVLMKYYPKEMVKIGNFK